MIFLKLFWTFFKIGLFTIGGGAAMLPLIQQETLSNGWLSEDMLLNIIGIAESTPGPIAVNVSTYIGASQAGIAGALCATLGVVLPSFIIILLIVKYFKNIMKNPFVNGALEGVRPVIVGLIISVGLYFALRVILPYLSVSGGTAGAVDWRAVGILAALTVVNGAYFIWKRKTIPPVAVIIAAAVLGMAVYAI